MVAVEELSLHADGEATGAAADAGMDGAVTVTGTDEIEAG